MAIAFGANVKKAEPATQAATESTPETLDTGVLATPEIKAAVDAAAGLKDAIAIAEKELKAMKKELAENEKKFIPLVLEHTPGNDTYTLEGNDRVATFSKEGSETVMTDKEAIYEQFEAHTPGLFFKLCNIGVTQIKNTLGSTNIKGMVTRPNGKRTVKY
jgi:hypothetical protein